MKNRSFHQRKIRMPETPKLDFDQLKSRTIIALNKLGQQKLSAEPGGYALENWARGVNILLDEFEEKMGEERLSSDYVTKRRELNDRLSKPISTSSIDKSIYDLSQSAADVQGRIDAGRARLASRLVELKREQDDCSTKLVQEQKRVSSLAADQSSDSFLKRLFVGSSKTPARDSKVKEPKSRLGVLSDEILGQQTLLNSIDRRSPESAFAEDWNALDSLQTRLEALECERLERVQLVKEREEITASIADTISTISP